MSGALRGQLDHNDPMDQFSIRIAEEPLKTNDGRELGKLITRTRRENPEKRSRTLGVVWDSRMPLVPEFSIEYSYLVRFSKTPGAESEPAGKHWHKAKNELMTAAHGKFRIVLENRETKQQAVCVIDSDARTEQGLAVEQSVYVPVGVAHAVSPLDDGLSSLLVVADHPGTLDDEFPYDMTVV